LGTFCRPLTIKSIIFKVVQNYIRYLYFIQIYCRVKLLEREEGIGHFDTKVFKLYYIYTILFKDGNINISLCDVGTDNVLSLGGAHS